MLSADRMRCLSTAGALVYPTQPLSAWSHGAGLIIRDVTQDVKAALSEETVHARLESKGQITCFSNSSERNAHPETVDVTR